MKLRTQQWWISRLTAMGKQHGGPHTEEIQELELGLEEMQELELNRIGKVIFVEHQFS